MTGREHRAIQKKWKSWKEKSRTKQLTNKQNTPSPSPEPGSSNSSTGNAKRGQKVLLKYKSKCVRENKKLKKQMATLDEVITKEKRKVEKYKKGIQRINKAQEMKLNSTPENELTPQSKTKRMLHDLQDDLKNSNNRQKKFLLMKSPVARTLTFHNAMVQSIKKTYSQTKSKTEKTSYQICSFLRPHPPLQIKDSCCTYHGLSLITTTLTSTPPKGKCKTT